jgi:hypothetical protein
MENFSIFVPKTCVSLIACKLNVTKKRVHFTSNTIFFVFLFSKTQFFVDIFKSDIQGDFESCADILITSYWFYVEHGKNV